MPRKVTIERISGGEHPHFVLGTLREGWELVRPSVGERYFIFTDAGAVFRSSRVTHVENGTFQTRNSTYAIRVIEDEEPNAFTTQELEIPVTLPDR
jgi:hypothetical protein